VHANVQIEATIRVLSGSFDTVDRFRRQCAIAHYESVGGHLQRARFRAIRLAFGKSDFRVGRTAILRQRTVLDKGLHYRVASLPVSSLRSSRGSRPANGGAMTRTFPLAADAACKKGKSFFDFRLRACTAARIPAAV